MAVSVPVLELDGAGAPWWVRLAGGVVIMVRFELGGTTTRMAAAENDQVRLTSLPYWGGFSKGEL